MRKILIVLLFASFATTGNLYAQEESVQSLIDQGEALLWEGDFEAAEQQLSSGLALEPDNVTALSSRCAARQLLGEIESAAEDCARALALGPDSMLANLANARLLADPAFEDNDINMALELANRSVELEPDSWVAYFNRALVRAANDAPDDALTDYDRAIELGMPYFQVYDEAALMATFWMDDPQRGLGYVEAGLAAHPDNPFLLADLGMINIYTGNFEDSLAPLQRAIEINPEIDLTYVTLGFANANLGNDADALAGYLDWVGIIEEERIEQEIVLSEYTTLQMVYGRVYALTFTLEDDTSVNIRTTRVSGVDPLIFVNDSNGEVIAYNDDRVLFGDDADLNSEINGLSLPAGTYTLIATHAGAGSDGLMRVIIEPAE